ncbi:hypothetical protein QYE76_047191 [Lolium multiflorum]|uniref:Exocyst subunit Exo70 family protein n=1 Tax=Lolium multiflorum TaxID=4521 RepID=A0AAD8X1Q6_LOLMU|nr:hypothetical protein QYE76_047191 [Lolium multiflorum]
MAFIHPSTNYQDSIMAEETPSSFAGLAEDNTRLASIQLASAPEVTTSSFAGLAEETNRLASIQLASVPEETSSSFAGLEATYPPPQSYRESIQSVVWPEWRIRSALSSQSGQSGSNYSSISSSYMSNMTCCSVGSTSAGTADFATDELTKIAHKMVSDGYIQRMVQTFKSNGELDDSLKSWFAELDIEWVFQLSIGEQSLLYGSASCLQEFVERWIRALTIIIISIKELAAGVNDTLVVARFGKASISAMLVFIDRMARVSNREKLPAMLQAYICVSNASYDMSTMHVISSDAQRIFNGIGGLLERKVSNLVESISQMITDSMRQFLKDGDWRNCSPYPYRRLLAYSISDSRWTTEIARGGGEVHKSTQLMVDNIMLIRKALTLTQKSTQSHNTGRLHDLIDDMINHQKDLLPRISKVCLDPSLGYLFLLNNSYFLAQVFEPSMSLDVELWSGDHQGLELTPECVDYMDSYIKVSWEDVLSWLSRFHGPLLRWINTSPLGKFQSAFHKTYQTQKFWKVPDPRLRSLLRETVTKRIITGYHDYLKAHPEVEKHISAGSNSPEVFEGMLGELFEG